MMNEEPKNDPNTIRLQVIISIQVVSEHHRHITETMLNACFQLYLEGRIVHSLSYQIVKWGIYQGKEE